MQKLVITLLLIPALWLSAHAQRIPTADEVIDRYFEAVGGKESLKKLKNVVIQATITANGVSYSETIKYKLPDKRFALVTDGKGAVSFREVVDGKQILTQIGKNILPTKPADLQRALLSEQFMPELLIKEKHITYTLAGTETLNGRETYKIVYGLPDVPTLWFSYYDAQTGLLVKSVYPFQDGTQTMEVSDYREVNGIKVPFRSIGFGVEAQMTKYEFNQSLNDAEFIIN